MDKNVRLTILFLIFLMINSFFIACDILDKTPSKEDVLMKEQTEREQRKEQVKNDLITRYNPIEIPNKDFSRKRLFTYTLHKYLINETQRPILFCGDIEDITNEDNKLFIHFSSPLVDYESGDFQGLIDKRKFAFHLRCNLQQIEPIISQPTEQSDEYERLFRQIFDGESGEYYVVCKVNEVSKIKRYEIVPVSSEEFEIEVPDIFSVKGELIEYVKY